jgi:hypothetical protein
MRPLLWARTSLATALFPPATSKVRWRSWRLVAAASLLVFVASAVQLLRLPHGAALNTIWAEDGTIFLQQAKSIGRLGAIPHTYNGYVHLLPRLIAAVAASFPVSAAAAVLGSLSALTAGVVALFVFIATREHIPSPWWRLGLSASIVFMPIAGTETLDNVANVQWYLIAAAFWALLWRPQGRVARAVQAVVCLVAAASAPLCVLLLPLAAARLVALRSPREQAPTLGLLAGLLVQFATGAVAPHAAQMAGVGTLAAVYAVRVVLTSLVGDEGTRSLFGRAGWLPVYVASAVSLTAVLAWALWHRRRGAAWLVLACVGTSILMFVVPVEQRWVPNLVPRASSPNAELALESRYMLVPIFALYSLVACALGGRWWRARGRGAQAMLAAVVVALVGTVWTLDFSATKSGRLAGTTWGSALDAARSTCRGTPAPASAAVAIAPPGWVVELPCRDIIGSGGS